VFVASRVAITTTIAAAASIGATSIYSRVFKGCFDLTFCLNGALAGLVSITASCAVVEVWSSFVIGVVGSCVYIAAALLIRYCGVDDPLNAFPVHGACGTWGLLAVGIFATRSNIRRAYGFDNDAMATGNQ